MGQFKNLRGKVVMFDGPDYVGKTTQLKLVKEALESDGLAVFTTRYNGGAPIGEALRKVMLSDYARPAMTELYINLAQQHALTEVLKTEQTRGSVILVDRSPLSIIAYQVFGSGVDEIKGFAAADEVMSLHRPDLVICYQAPESILAERRHKGGHETDFFESKPDSYFKHVNEGYQAGIKRYKPTLIKATGTISDVHEATMTALIELA